MAASTFFTRLLLAPKPAVVVRAPDNLGEFDAAWGALKETLEHPNERQLLRGISATDVPRQLKHIVDALVYEGNRTDEDTTGACLEYFLRHDMLGQLERLCERDRPRGVKAEVLRAVNNLVVLLSERFLVHNAVHRPLRRLLRSCVGDAPLDKVDGEKRVFGAGALEDSVSFDNALEEDLVDLMCILCSRMRAYPPLLLIFFHDRGWLVPHNSSGAMQPPPPPPEPPSSRSLGPARALSPTPSMQTGRSAISGISAQSGSDPATTTHFEFLLFSYLLRFVHREGRTGDFARAGLLFLFDIAFLTVDEGDGLTMAPAADGSDPLQDARDALAEYILDGDFADVMAAGLGAAFSVLPSKVRVPNLAEQAREDPTFNSSGGMHIGAAEKVDEHDELMELPSSTDMDVRAQLDILLKLFGFLQDILYRCRSPVLYADPSARTVSTTQVLGPAVADAALDAIQTAFVDNVLYPCILECSSNDGSAVAVLTYLDVLLSNLENGPVLHRILDVLSDADGAVPAFSPKKKGRNRKQRKTGAMGFVTPMTPHPSYYHNEGRFTLRDLLLDNLRSGAAPASAASLHLLATLLSDHCRHITPSLFTIIRDPTATAVGHRPLPPRGATTWQSHLPVPSNSTDVHVQEPELYGALVPRLDDAVTGSVDTASGFASYLTDAHAFLEADGCWVSSRVPLQFVSDDGKPALLRVGEHEMDPLQHALAPSDPIMRELIAGLTRWFTSSPDTNVALTGAVSALARCPHRSLAGWLLYDPPEADEWNAAREKDDGGNDSDTSFDGSRPTSRRDSSPPQRPLPALYQILRELVRHVGRFRAFVEGFDRLLAERRQGLLFADHLEEAMSAMLEPDAATPPQSPLAPVPRKASLASSIKSLWSLSPRRKRTVSTAAAAAPTSPVVVPPSPSVAATVLAQSASASGPSTPLRGSRDSPVGLSFGSAPVPVPVPGHSHSPRLNPPHYGTEGTSPPFKSHYVQTADAGSLDVEPVLAVQAGRWKGANGRAGNESGNGSGNGHSHGSGSERDDEEDAHTRPPEIPTPSRTSLSAVLDNCIVLEELIKELVALITARRALGIDQVGFISF